MNSNNKIENELPLSRKEKIFQEILMPDDINVPINEPKDELNPEIWNGLELKKEIRFQLLKIAKAFHEFLKIDIKIKDVVFTGSMANYNWTSNSDIDLHLLLDMDGIDIPREFLEEYLVAKKIIWNDNREIFIKGYEVELYAKDEENLTSSKGVFSVLKNEWIQIPSKDSPEIDELSVKEKAVNLMNSIDTALKIKDEKKQFITSEKILDKIKKLRKSGLEKGGEYSIENLAFKVLRKNGYLEKIVTVKQDAFDSSLSLDEMELNENNIKKGKKLIKENKENKGHKYEYGCLMLQLNKFKGNGWGQILKKINPDDVYDSEEGFGMETEPHITVLFGFHSDETKISQIKDMVKKHLNGKKEINTILKGMSLFKNGKFDVLKLDVESPELNDLNKVMKNRPYTSDYPDYTPHSTIAYLKPGRGKKYIQEFNNAIELKSDTFKYSSPDENETFSTNEFETVTLGIQKDIEDMTPEKVEIIQKFISFVINRLDLKEPISLFLHKGRDEYIVTTASYDPSENANHVRVQGRAIVDILRSIAHELTHNRQREIGSFDINEPVQNIGGWIEDEANAKAGILIKDFALNLGNERIYEI